MILLITLGCASTKVWNNFGGILSMRSLSCFWHFAVEHSWMYPNELIWHMQVPPFFRANFLVRGTFLENEALVFRVLGLKRFGQTPANCSPKRSSNGQVSKKLERNYVCSFFMKNTVPDCLTESHKDWNARHLQI